MAVFKFPSCTIHELEAIFRDFLWAQGESSKGKCKVAWKDVCRPLSSGGIGIKNLSAWNRALLAKNIWDIVSKRKSLWVRWIYHFYIKDHSIWMTHKKGHWSWVSCKIFDIRDQIRAYIVHIIGDGNNTNAWEDNWLNIGPLAPILSYRLIHASGFCTSNTVREVVEQMADGWPNAWVSKFPALANSQIPYLDDTMLDSVRWKDVSGKLHDFSVKEAWKSIQEQGEVSLRFKVIWTSGFVPKHAFCLWLACSKRLPTQDRIGAWKHDPPDMKCPLCNTIEDSHDHLFFNCGFSAMVWAKVQEDVGLVTNGNNWNDITSDMDSYGKPDRTVHRLALAAAVYFIWQERNNRLFCNQIRNERDVALIIRNSVLQRLAWKNRNKVNIR